MGVNPHADKHSTLLLWDIARHRELTLSESYCKINQQEREYKAMVPILAAISIGLIIVFTMIACLIIGYCGFRLYKLLSKIEADLTSLAESNKSATALLDGILKICESLVASSLKMSESVSSFQGNLFPSGSGRDAFQAYSDQSAGDAFKITQMMQGLNISHQEAKDRVQSGAEEGTFFVTD